MKTKAGKTTSKTPAKKAESKLPEEPKKFLEHQHSNPYQLSLFDLLDNEKDFSHTIELYDFMPKYVWGKVERVGGVFLPRLEREFECRGKKYKLILFPAGIEDETDGKKYYYSVKSCRKRDA